MTYNPTTLAALGAYWVRQGGVNLGVVGDAAHAGRATYHNGKDRIVARLGTSDPAAIARADYSARTTRDRAGLTNAASAIDLGKLDGSYTPLRKFSVWLVEQARKNAPGTRDIREIIYTDDGQRVLRWDRERGYSSAPRTGEADNSHLYHTHISYYRDSENRDKVALFATYFGGGAGAVVPITLFENPRKARLTKDAVLYEDPELTKVAWKDLDQTNPDGSVRYFLYPGFVSADVAIVGYEPTGGDAGSRSPALYVKASHIAGSSPLYEPPAPAPDPDCADEIAVAVNAAVAAEKERIAVAVGQAAASEIRSI